MKIDLIKAWKDEEYRATLSQEQLQEISNPAGLITLSDNEMQNVNGGNGGTFTLCCSNNTIDFVQNVSCCCRMK